MRAARSLYYNVDYTKIKDTTRVRSMFRWFDVCLAYRQVPVEREDWMVLAIDKYDYGIF